MSEEDIYQKALGWPLEYSHSRGEFQKAHFWTLFAEERVLVNLKQSLKVDVEALTDGYVLHTLFGDMFIEFSQGLDGQYMCPVAIFRDLDDQGQKRDLYAVKLNVERGSWVDSNGKTANIDRMSGLTSSMAPFEFVQAALAQKLRLCEERFTKLKK